MKEEKTDKHEKAEVPSKKYKYALCEHSLTLKSKG